MATRKSSGDPPGKPGGSDARGARVGKSLSREDRGFDRILSTKDSTQIVADLTIRMDKSRLAYSERALKAAQAETAILKRESERRGALPSASRDSVARLDSRIASAAGEIHLHSVTVEAIKTASANKAAPAAEAVRWVGVGRVVSAEGRPVPGARVVFLDRRDTVISVLGRHPVDEKGNVRIELSGDALAKVPRDERTNIRLAAELKSKIIAVDTTFVAFDTNIVHKFELRISGEHGRG